MAATHRILDDLFEETYSLFAVHSSLDDYAVAYALNQHLKIGLRRLRTDLDIAQGISFPIFEWRDLANDRYWTLISNHSLKEVKGTTDDLFSHEPSFTTNYLLPEYKDVDYLLKIEGEAMEEDDALVRKITSVPKMITAYAIETDKLKSKKNLIF